MLSPFEYVTVLISIILGLGITQIVTGLADIIHQWKQIKLYWPHTFWMLIIFFLHIQEWWNIYDLRLYDVWRLPTFLFISLYPINLFILSRLLFPIHSHEEVVLDYKAFFMTNYRKFFFGVIISALLSGLENYFISSHGLEGIILQAAIILVLSVVALKKIQAEWVHKLIVTVWILAIIASIIINWDVWLIT
jgi:hypothetical protein